MASPCLLTIAGFDPSSGAGITADLAVFAAHRCFGISAVTAMTVQSTQGVRRVQPVDAAVLSETLDCLELDLPPVGIKIGMLADQAQVRTVTRYLLSLAGLGRKPVIVLDPVLFSSSGALLLTAPGVDTLLRELLPQVSVVTPNIAELALLTGMPCHLEEQIEQAAGLLALRYPGLSVLATGGDRAEPDDVLLHAGVFTKLKGRRVATKATHGTGCALSSALICGMVCGDTLPCAASAAKLYVEKAMRLAEPRGAGPGPLQLLWPLLEQGEE